jgi:REP element-mobilizing transposase RayT
MPKTLGYHIVLAGYGLWLPGDERGSWSTAWDEQLGLIEPHMLHSGDPVRRRMSEERQKHPPVRLTQEMIRLVVSTLADCQSKSDWTILAASIEDTHTHLLLTYTDRDIDNTIKWLKDQITKAVHRNTNHSGPVWCKGRWRTFIFEEEAWAVVKNYIENHNIRRGLEANPHFHKAATGGRAQLRA